MKFEFDDGAIVLAESPDLACELYYMQSEEFFDLESGGEMEAFAVGNDIRYKMSVKMVNWDYSTGVDYEYQAVALDEAGQSAWRELENFFLDPLKRGQYMQNKTSKKHDLGKLRWDLLPLDAPEAIVKVLTYGAEKYGADTWQDLPNGKDRYFAALMRHLVAWRRGEAHDAESGLPHIDHVLCNAAFLKQICDSDK